MTGNTIVSFTRANFFDRFFIRPLETAAPVREPAEADGWPLEQQVLYL
jgi:hypothetical protein